LAPPRKFNKNASRDKTSHVTHRLDNQFELLHNFIFLDIPNAEANRREKEEDHHILNRGEE
jgi:hypothetical protein